ncbi:hypothetical protein HRbin12_01047 [bacterium HR12]|nr:hypothetical protein HRbin12_01047 [bacterium HR12]
MSSHDLTVAVYGLIGLAGLGLELLAWSGRTRVPRLGDVLADVMRTRSGRVGVVAGWAWLGLHFFVR